jgi:HIRAN domain
MISGLHDAKLRWRRVAVFGPVHVELEDAAEAGPRRRFPAGRDASVRVVLRHEPTVSDPDAVALYTSSGRRIGSLCPDVAAWVAAALDSETTAFEGEIWPLDPAAFERGRLSPGCTMTLIQYELLPVAQSAWRASLLGAVLPRVSSR